MQSRWLKNAAALSAVALLLAALTACGSSGSSTPAKTDDAVTATPLSQAPEVPSDARIVVVTVKGDSVTPSSEPIEVSPNQPIVFKITADVAGELHVHSSPAQSIEYPAGQSQVQIKIDKPGVAEAEIEQLSKTVVQITVK